MEAFSVAVRVSLINGAASGLMALARQFKTTHVSAMALKKELRSIELLMLGGGLMAATGMFGLHIIGKTLPYAKEYANQLSLMNTLGMKQADIAKVVGQAWKTSFTVPTTTAAENLKSFRELRSVFGVGHEGEASMMLPVVGKIQGILTALTGHEQEKVGFDLVKAIELRTGVMTPKALQSNAELMTRTLLGMGGTLNVGDFHGALKQGRMATNKWSDDFTYNYLPTLMQEVKTGNGGAQSAGTILQSLYQQAHGRMTKAAMPLWVQSGLIHANDVVKNGTGSYQVKPGAVAGIGIEESNPYQWVQQYLRPAVDRLAAAKHLTPETVINSMFSNRMAAFGAYNMYTKAQQYDRDKKNINQADSLDAYNKLLKTNPELAQLALQKQWQNLLAQLGFTIMPTLIKGMTTLMSVLQGITKLSRAHPTVTKFGMESFAGFSAFLAVGGLITMTAGAFKAFALAFKVLGSAATYTRAFSAALSILATGLEVGAAVIASPITWIVAAVASVGVAVYEIWKHWDSSKSIFQNIKSELGMFWSFLTGLPGQLWNALPAWARGALGAAGKAIMGDPKKQAAAAANASAALQSNVGNIAQGFRTGASISVHNHNTFKVDGKTLAQATTTHLIHTLGGQNTGARNSDPKATPAVAGAAMMGGHG